MELFVPTPPKALFENRNVATTSAHANIVDVYKEGKNLSIIDHFEYPEEGGIYVHYVNRPFPDKGFPTPEAVATNNIVKRLFITQIGLLVGNINLYLPWKRDRLIKNWVKGFSGMVDNIAERVQSSASDEPGYFMEYRFYMNFSKAIMKFVETFLKELDIISFRLPLIVGTIFEYESAYRWRIEDLMSETNQGAMAKNPRKEIRKLIRLFTERDNRKHLVKKFDMIARLATLILWIPKVRRAFNKAVGAIQFEHLQLDEADRYIVMNKSGYDFLGLSAEQRLQEFLRLQGNMPFEMYNIKF